MDTYNDYRMASDKMLAALSGKPVVVGARQIKKALLAHRISRVFLARNADPAIVEPIVALCKEYSTEFLWVRTMAELGSACGIEVGASVAAAVNIV